MEDDVYKFNVYSSVISRVFLSLSHTHTHTQKHSLSLSLSLSLSPSLTLTHSLALSLSLSLSSYRPIILVMYCRGLFALLTYILIPILSYYVLYVLQVDLSMPVTRHAGFENMESSLSNLHFISPTLILLLYALLLSLLFLSSSLPYCSSPTSLRLLCLLISSHQ